VVRGRRTGQLVSGRRVDRRSAAALARADEVQQAIGRDIAVAVYRAHDRSGASTYAVTLGGYMRETLARERAAQARSAGLAHDAYAHRSADWGSDLRPTRTEQRLIEIALRRHAGAHSEITPETPLTDALAVAPAQVAKAVIALAHDEGIALDERCAHDPPAGRHARLPATQSREPATDAARHVRQGALRFRVGKAIVKRSGAQSLDSRCSSGEESASL